MKKQFLLLAGSAVLFASCGSNNNNQAQTQAQIDSAVNAGVQKHDAENAAKNDSVLKAMEKEKADAMTKEHQSSGGSHKPGHKTPAAEPAPPPPPAPPHNPKEDRFNTNPDGSKKTTTVDPNAPNKKADRFK
jgi:hypothetical protein